ncbi:hypothetical protein RF11_05278 [Thelohanellus kitauei]|uniref:Uncharacterized protein n=1 Tax=Thelohanellus kitauei TaxID=669202 RepID=A0A0C2JI87_THEKT|nr:hypothetical protein RF11_05278 [Thelohanellus kitauei]
MNRFLTGSELKCWESRSQILANPFTAQVLDIHTCCIHDMMKQFQPKVVLKSCIERMQRNIYQNLVHDIKWCIVEYTYGASVFIVEFKGRSLPSVRKYPNDRMLIFKDKNQ